MEGYLDTRGMQYLAIAICDRCKIKHPLADLYADGNIPSLKVCLSCRDAYDPWRLPARSPDQITLRYPRPDVPLDV
jgi:hypothetical protein